MGRDKRKVGDPAADVPADEQTLAQLNDAEIDAAVEHLEPENIAGVTSHAADEVADLRSRGGSPALIALWNVVGRLEVIAESLRITVTGMQSRRPDPTFRDPDDDSLPLGGSGTPVADPVLFPVAQRDAFWRGADHFAAMFSFDGSRLMSDQHDHLFQALVDSAVPSYPWGESQPHCIWAFPDGSEVLTMAPRGVSMWPRHKRLWDVLDENGVDSSGTTWGVRKPE
jgi:hypothetical protein